MVFFSFSLFIEDLETKIFHASQYIFSNWHRMFVLNVFNESDCVLLTEEILLLLFFKQLIVLMIVLRPTKN